MQALRERLAVQPEDLRRRLDPASLPFQTTAEIAPVKTTVGQPRAAEAIAFALEIPRAFEGEDYGRRREQSLAEMRTRRAGMSADLRAFGEARGFGLEMGPAGINKLPLHNGAPMRSCARSIPTSPEGTVHRLVQDRLRDMRNSCTNSATSGPKATGSRAGSSQGTAMADLPLVLALLAVAINKEGPLDVVR